MQTLKASILEFEMYGFMQYLFVSYTKSGLKKNRPCNCPPKFPPLSWLRMFFFCVDLADHSLALQQHVGLSEQRNLWSQAPLAVRQVADVTPQLLLALPARLQLTLQLPQLLLQPDIEKKRKNHLGSDFPVTRHTPNSIRL